MPDIAVIICTHNPRPNYLRRVCDALQAQTLPREKWEFLVVDNASEEKLENSFDFSWHPDARCIREDELGLTAARLRGIAESRSELILFVDDDNVLDPDYVQGCIQIGRQYPEIGAWCGSSTGEYEIEPPEILKPHLKGLAIVEIDRDYWSNLAAWTLATPYGAGMCVRRNVAEKYAANVRSDPLRGSLGRKGNRLFAGEDVDLAFTAIDLGLGTGRFHRLKLIHLIPKERLTETYIVNLFAGFAATHEILAAIRPPEQPFSSTRLGSWLRYWRRYLTRKGIERKILRESERATKATRKYIESVQRREI
jgi:glycosyltransferase involved in cell wall biosynthesis